MIKIRMEGKVILSISLVLKDGEYFSSGESSSISILGHFDPVQGTVLKDKFRRKQSFSWKLFNQYRGVSGIRNTFCQGEGIGRNLSEFV